jgi:transposase
VTTTTGPIVDGEATPKIHAALDERALLPGTHIVDTGYVDAELLMTSRRDYGIDLLGPARPDAHWQARANEGFAAAQFRIDWDRQQAMCPAGHASSSWTPAVDNRRTDVSKIKFSATHCRPCPFRKQCVHSGKKYPRRTLTVRPQAQYEALQAARQRAQTPEYAATYARRAGIEGTLSRGVRRCGLRRTRYIGQARTHLGHVLTAVALNVLRVSEWLSGIARPKTRHSPFEQLLASAAST